MTKRQDDLKALNQIFNEMTTQEALDYVTRLTEMHLGAFQKQEELTAEIVATGVNTDKVILMILRNAWIQVAQDAFALLNDLKAHGVSVAFGDA